MALPPARGGPGAPRGASALRDVPWQRAMKMLERLFLRKRKVHPGKRTKVAFCRVLFWVPIN